MMVLVLLLLFSSWESASMGGTGAQSQENQEWERVRTVVDQCKRLEEEEQDGDNSIGHKKDKKETCRNAAHQYGVFINKYSTNKKTEAYVENLFRYGLLLEACGNYALAEVAYMDCDEHPRKFEAVYLGLSIGRLIETRLKVVRRKLKTIERMDRKTDVIQ